MTRRAIQQLIDELHRHHRRQGWYLPFLSHGAVGFDAIAASLAAAVNERYILNALYILLCLVREACPDRITDLLGISLRYSADNNIAIRSYSSLIAIQTSTTINQ